MSELSEEDTILQIAQGHIEFFRKAGIAAEWQLSYTAWPGANNTASIKWSTGYRWADIRINTEDEIVKVNDWRFRFSLLHELCHLLLAPMHDILDQNFVHDSPMHEMFGMAFETAVDNAAIALWKQLEVHEVFAKALKESGGTLD